MQEVRLPLRHKQILAWLLLMAWTAFIFCLSHQPASVSNKLSTEVAETVVSVAQKIAPQAVFDIRNVNRQVRKSSHFLAYLVLGILVMNGLDSYKIRGHMGMTVALAICVFYAISDEVHQLFVSGRGAQVGDVLVDSAGAMVGIWLFLGADRIKSICWRK